jgi:hypothetical protein
MRRVERIRVYNYNIESSPNCLEYSIGNKFLKKDLKRFTQLKEILNYNDIDMNLEMKKKVCNETLETIFKSD